MTKSLHSLSNAKSLLEDGKLLESYSVLIATDTNNPDEILLKGQLLYQLKKYDDAVLCLMQNLFRPDYSKSSLDFWLHILNEQKSLEKALPVLKELCKRYPTSIEFEFGLATVLYSVGLYAESVPHYERSLSLSGENFVILNAISKAHLVLGNIKEASHYAQRSVSLNPYNPDSLRIISLDHKFEYGDPQFFQMNLAATRMSDYSLKDQLQLHYGLSKAFFDVGELPSAFGHLEAAGIKHQNSEPFNREKILAIYDNLKAKITGANLQKVDEPSCNSKKPILILGMPRSGTTLLEQILSGNNGIFGAGELMCLGRVIEGMTCGNFRLSIGHPDSLFKNDQQASWKARGQAYVDYLSAISGDSPYVIDKMPANYHYVGMTHALLPNALQIHMLRHPMEVCFSCYRTLFTEGHEWSFRLDDLAFQYRQYWEIMKHWNSEFPGLLFEVYYENLIADPEFETRRILDRLGLPWDSKCLEFHKSNRPVKTASVAQVRKPIYHTSNNRWKRYEKYLSPLAEQLSDIIAEYETMLQNSRNNA